MIYKKTGVIKRIGSLRHEKPNYGTSFLKPWIIVKKNDSSTIKLDARHLNSSTDQSFEFWPLEPLATQLVGANKSYESAFDHIYAYLL